MRTNSSHQPLSAFENCLARISEKYLAGISETERKWRNDSNKWATQVNFAAWAIEVLF